MSAFLVSQILFVVAAVVALVLLVSARGERRRASAASYDWLVAAIVAFILVSIPIDQLGYHYASADNPYWLRLAPLGLLLFPGFLAHSICALCGIRGIGLRVSDAITVALATLLLLSPTFPGADHPDPPIWYLLLVIGIVVEMLVSTIVSIRALRRVSMGQPHIVRSRAALMIGAQVVFTMTFLGWISSPGPTLSLAANCLLVVVGALLIAALVWPRPILRLIDAHPRDRWKAFGVLMASADVRHDLAGILDDVAATWGLLGVAMLDRDGELVELLGDVRLDSGATRSMGEHRFGDAGGVIVIWTSALSLPVGKRDRDYLTLLATMVQFALDREVTIGHQVEAAASAAAAAESLAIANQRLVETDELKSRFVSLVSHELRTPLTSVIGLARTARDRWDELDDDQLREFQRIIVEQAERLSRIVETLLVTSRIEASVIGNERERIDVRGVLDAAILDAGLADSTPEVAIADDANWVIGDQQALHEIFVNLLANARSYGQPPIRVRAARVADAVELTVSDAGSGVDAAIEDRIFDRFVRGTSVEQAGTGLGLSIVHELALALDGEVGYRRLDPGSEFWIRLAVAGS